MDVFNAVATSCEYARVAKYVQLGVAALAGPPGTGKTVTSASIVYQLAKLGQGQVHPGVHATCCKLLSRSSCI